MRTDEAPAARQDQPGALAHLDDVFELARLEEPAWPAMHEKLMASGALLNDGTEAGDAGEGKEPTPGGEHSEEAGNGDDPNQPGGEEESFTDFDLDSLEGDARQAAEAAQRRMQADYTRKTQELSQRGQEAAQYQAIVDGLFDPERAPEILRILGIEAGSGSEEDDLLTEDDLYGSDKTQQQLDEMREQIQARDAALEEREITDQEDQQIAEQIESWESSQDEQLSKDEIAFVYLYADELRDEQGQPNVKAAIDLLEGIVANRQQQWIASKKAPRRVAPGKSASRQVDLPNETTEDRVKRMAEAAEAARGTAE